MSQTPVIGIDLGTTYCCVGIYEDDSVKIVNSKNGKTTTPSYVAFVDSELPVNPRLNLRNLTQYSASTEQLFGEAAKTSPIVKPENIFFDIKRLIGHNYHDSSVQAGIKHWPFKVVDVGGKWKWNGKAAIALSNILWQHNTSKYQSCFSPKEISSRLLVHMKDLVTDYLNSRNDGNDVRMDAVITVPAYFNDAQRQATEAAAEDANLNVFQILDEPAAAIITYIHEYKKDPNLEVPKGLMLVYDLGGGTLDVSIFYILCTHVLEKKLNGNRTVNYDDEIKVIGIGGDTHLGGRDFDNNLVDYMIARIQEEYEKDIKQNQQHLRTLRNKCEEAKCKLSTNTETQIIMNIDGTEVRERISRELFEDLCEDEFQKTITIVENTIESAGCNKDDIEVVILSGGSTKIPKVQSMLKNYFPSNVILHKMPNLDEAVAYGATLLAGQIASKGGEVGFHDSDEESDFCDIC